MDGRLLRGHLLGIILLALTGSVAVGQQWANDMFNNKTSHDFGTVARGAKVEFKFVCENIYEEDAHISKATPSCGCVTAKISQKSLKTWEKSVITVAVDTRGPGPYKQRKSTIVVVLDKPFPAEVRLNIHYYLRSDVVVQPGTVKFGTVAQGTEVQRKLNVNYAGRSDWAITKVETENPHLEISTAETKRGNGLVGYDLWVKLKKTAPPGYIRDHIRLVTNDTVRNRSRVPILVEGRVASSFTVSPSPLLLGVVSPGRPVTRELLVRGQEPFRIVAARCDDKRFTCNVPQEAKSLHLLRVTFTPGADSGKVSGIIHIQTDQTGAKDIPVAVHVQVVPP